MEKLIDYLKEEKIRFDLISETVLSINGETYVYTLPLNGAHFTAKFELVHQDIGYDNIIIFFGARYYYIPSHQTKDFELKELKYIGACNEEEPTQCFLGVHGGFELLKGSRSYKDWCEKAKFLGVKNLGICEKGTLAGTLKFQKECLRNEINPILGASYRIKKEDGSTYDVKLYIENDQGWINILSQNYANNVTNDSFIREDYFLSNLEGLIVVLDPKEMKFEDIPSGIEGAYYQLEGISYADDRVDLEYLENLKKFASSDIMPVSISDAYYLDKEDWWVVDTLETMSKSYSDRIKYQYFKSKTDHLMELEEIIKDFDVLLDLFDLSVANEIEIANRCKFNIPTGERHLPEYVMTEDEKALYGTNRDMLWTLIEEGLERLYPDFTEEHIERIEKEVSVLEMGGVIDYFLITRDIINAAEAEGILTGVARGSAGGSIVSYLLGIIKIDPLEFNLIFERFLNEGRVTKSLPDIDSDFEGASRPWVKTYIEKRFGETQVCSVGTYTTMKIKGAIKDLVRQTEADFKEANIITSCISDDDKTVTDLFKRMCLESKLSKFIFKYPEVFYRLPKVLNQPKARSIHACAMIIFPNNNEMRCWTPLKLHDGTILTEWEGGEMDSAGFLKQDILGIKQLDKFKQILTRIKDNGKDVPDIYNLPLDDAKVYEYFSKGWNSDVFQFGSNGLTGYSKQLKPNNINDLIAGVALYRPGAMENGFHETYIKRKNGEEAVTYPWGTEEITKGTYGIYVYQEQIMSICTKIGGFSLTEADDIRSALGKKIMEKLVSFKEKFLDGATENGCPYDEALDMWSAMLEFAKYSFNLSHSASYAITGYICQWLKVNFPLEYWATAFDFADDDDIPKYLSEIRGSDSIKELPPEINVSDTGISSNNNDTIFWGLSSIKNIGDKATDQIMKDRNENGAYTSLSNFIVRHNYKGSKVNKRVYEGLIMSGAFDISEGIDTPIKRVNLLNKYWEQAKVKVDESKSWKHKNIANLSQEWPWLLEQKRLSGFAFFNYTQLCLDYLGDSNYISNERMSVPIMGIKGCIGGVVLEAFERTSTRGKYAKLILESNYEMHNVMIWSEEYADLGVSAKELEGAIMLISGDIKFEPTYSKANQMIATSKGKIKILKNN